MQVVPPGPVPRPRRRRIHPRLTAQMQYILHGKDAEIRHRPCRRADHRPHNVAFMLDSLKIRLDVGPLDIRRTLAPLAQGRIVVVRTGVRNRVWNVTVRKIQMRAAIRKTELQNPHPRHAEVLSQLIHLGGNQPEVFGNEWQIAKDLLQPLKKLVSRSLDPLPVDRGLFVGRDRPERLEAAEVVEANHVIQRQRAPNPRHPPVESALLQLAPPV